MTTLQSHRDNLVERLIDLAIEEDVYTGDVTTDSIVPESTSAVATMTAKADGVISGLPVVEKVFRRFQEDIVFKPVVRDGDTVRKGDVILRIEGSYPALLKAERTALNFFQRMSGIATETAKYVAELRGTHTRLLDTRKTAPGMRVTDKMAVHDGGAVNHRMGLYDMAMIKDNHIKMAGSIAKAVEQVRSKVAPGIQIEVEATNLDEVKEALEARADIIMLDNMSTEMMRDAVNIIGGRAKTEASGNMTLPRIAEVAATGPPEDCRGGGHRCGLHQRGCSDPFGQGPGHQHEHTAYSGVSDQGHKGTETEAQCSDTRTLLCSGPGAGRG